MPTGWTLQSATCDNGSGGTLVGGKISSITVAADETVTCTFTNKLNQGAILITKTRKHAADGTGDHPHPGVSFTVNGVTKQTDANGKACFDGLPFGSYNVAETVPDRLRRRRPDHQVGDRRQRRHVHRQPVRRGDGQLQEHAGDRHHRVSQLAGRRRNRVSVTCKDGDRRIAPEPTGRTGMARTKTRRSQEH